MAPQLRQFHISQELFMKVHCLGILLIQLSVFDPSLLKEFNGMFPLKA